jgi:hypothetical protein
VEESTSQLREALRTVTTVSGSATRGGVSVDETIEAWNAGGRRSARAAYWQDCAAGWEEQKHVVSQPDYSDTPGPGAGLTLGAK